MLHVMGHRLVDNGSPYGKRGCDRITCLAYGARRLSQEMNPDGGHARCVCDWTSEHLPSNRERREAYERHKRDVLSAQHALVDGAFA